MVKPSNALFPFYKKVRVLNLEPGGSAGYLYEPNNYEQMYEHARELVENPEVRQRMGQQAREHVARLGWLSAIRRIRNEQYGRAINIFRAHKR
jgi:sulfoquinovosyltransferase